MKIIFICTKSITFNTFLKSQANYFKKKGFKVEVACSDTHNLEFKKKLTHKINFPHRITNLFNLMRYIKIYFQIKLLVKKNRSNLFFIHTPVAAHIFRLFTFFYNLNIIYFVHGFRFTSKTGFIKAFFFKAIEKVLSFKTKIFITINKEDFNYVNNNFKGALSYKVNGVGLDLKKNHIDQKIKKKRGIRKILVIAAYKKEKGYLEILKVAEIFKNQNIHIDCYGYGNKSKFNLIKINKKIRNISFKNFDVNLETKIKNYDILLHLSEREGLPVSLMQCLSRGLPVICYNIRGNNDLIQDKFNGFFVNSYEDVFNKILYLNLNLKFFNQMRYNASKSLKKNFSKKQINLNLFKIIKNYIK